MLIWAIFGHVDIVASASGKVVPNGRVKLIQPFETGVVRAIHVRDSQRVKAGDVLIELDPTMTTAEQEHIRSDLIAAELDVARLRAALSDSDDPQTVFQPPAAASADLIAMQRQFLAGRLKSTVPSSHRSIASGRRKQLNVIQSQPQSASSKPTNRSSGSAWTSENPSPIENSDRS